jgi:hypothetical protein
VAEYVNTLTSRTLGYLIQRYQLPSNRNWVDLTPSERRKYEKVFGWLVPFHDLQLRNINPAALARFRKMVPEQGKWQFANHVLQVTDTLLTWANQQYPQYSRVAQAEMRQPSGDRDEPHRTSSRRYSTPPPFRLLPPGTRKNNPFYIVRGRDPTSGKTVEISTRTRVRQKAEARARDYWRQLQLDTARTMRRVVPDVENARVATPDLPELTGKTETSGEAARKPFKVRKKPGANPIGEATGGVPPARKLFAKTAATPAVRTHLTSFV